MFLNFFNRSCNTSKLLGRIHHQDSQPLLFRFFPLPFWQDWTDLWFESCVGPCLHSSASLAWRWPPHHCNFQSSRKTGENQHTSSWSDLTWNDSHFCSIYLSPLDFYKCFVCSTWILVTKFDVKISTPVTLSSCVQTNCGIYSGAEGVIFKDAHNSLSLV